MSSRCRHIVQKALAMSELSDISENREKLGNNLEKTDVFTNEKEFAMEVSECEAPMQCHLSELNGMLLKCNVRSACF